MEELFPSRVVKSFVARPKPMTHISMLTGPLLVLLVFVRMLVCGR